MSIVIPDRKVADCVSDVNCDTYMSAIKLNDYRDLGQSSFERGNTVVNWHGGFARGIKNPLEGLAWGKTPTSPTSPEPAGFPANYWELTYERFAKVLNCNQNKFYLSGMFQVALDLVSVSVAFYTRCWFIYKTGAGEQILFDSDNPPAGIVPAAPNGAPPYFNYNTEYSFELLGDISNPSPSNEYESHEFIIRVTMEGSGLPAPTFPYQFADATADRNRYGGIRAAMLHLYKDC